LSASLIIPAFLVPHPNHLAAAEPPDAAHDGLVVAEKAVAVELEGAFDKPADVIHGIGAVRVASKEDAVPRGQVRVYFGAALPEFALARGELGGHSLVALLHLRAKGFNLLL